MSTRVLIADDHTILRDGLSRALQKEEDMDVVGQAASGRDTVEIAKELLPDVVIMDIAMPDLNGIEATREILRDCPDIKVVALSMHSSKKFVTETFKAGACGYLLKNCEFDELIQAIRAVLKGQTYLSPAITGIMIDSYVRPATSESATAFGTLTHREREVLQLLAEGKTTKQIALKLHISPKTVEAHRLNIMNKLEIDNVAQLTKYAIQQGLTSAEF